MSHSPDDKSGEELLPCPHCGGKASFGTVEDDHANYGAQFIDCSECGASTNLVFPCKGDVTRELRERWNRRSTPSHVAAPQRYTPEELLRVAENTLIPMDMHKRSALMALIAVLGDPDKIYEPIGEPVNLEACARSSTRQSDLEAFVEELSAYAAKDRCESCSGAGCIGIPGAACPSCDGAGKNRLALAFKWLELERKVKEAQEIAERQMNDAEAARIEIAELRAARSAIEPPKPAYWAWHAKSDHYLVGHYSHEPKEPSPYYGKPLYLSAPSPSPTELPRRKGWNAGIERAAEVAEQYAKLANSESCQRVADSIRSLKSEG